MTLLDEQFVNLTADVTNWQGDQDDAITEETYDLSITDDHVIIGWIDGMIEFRKKDFLESICVLLLMRKEVDQDTALDQLIELEERINNGSISGEIEDEHTFSDEEVLG